MVVIYGLDLPSIREWKETMNNPYIALGAKCDQFFEIFPKSRKGKGGVYHI